MTEISTSDPSAEAERERAGLCAECRHGRRTRSDRGSVFLLCSRALADPAYPKYPRLPMRRCAGFEAGAPDGDARIE